MSLPDGVCRWGLIVEYNGALFQGFQRQKSATLTVQGELEKALSIVANEPITLVCAGRTDAGVHATGQVVHFDTSAIRSEKAWVEGANSHLPGEIRILSAIQTEGAFHARFSAVARTYRYVTYCSRVRPAILANCVTWSRHSYDVAAMAAAASYLLGEQDFSAFRASQCQAHNPNRNILAIDFYASMNMIVMQIKANAFLHHMVRNIMGSLFVVGKGERQPQWLLEVLHSLDRNRAAATAPPHGLYLAGVDYPEILGMPQSVQGPYFVDAIVANGALPVAPKSP